MFVLLVLWDAHDILSVYHDPLDTSMFDIEKVVLSMFDGGFGLKRLCLTWPVDCCIYA